LIREPPTEGFLAVAIYNSTTCPKGKSHQEIFRMRKLLATLTICASIGLAACGGSDGSSDSGGGSDLNLNGSWRVHHHFNQGSTLIRTYTLTLTQIGNTVTGSNIVPDPGPGPSPDAPCDGKINIFKGTVSGDRFNGTVTSDIYTESISLTGTSNYLSGSFTVTYPPGSCHGTYKGSLIMTRT
jgi:hypothetical protein